ncbi:MAG: hypothetical protein IPK68_09945 [Bdellovibrionales bacterium]|nr:hypothetical protein [Bdellovibrionales bacterium]
MSKSLKLSKSRIADGLVCEKKVYLSIHNPDLKAAVTPSQQARFDAGNEVGERARDTFPGGILIDREYWQIEDAIDDTARAIADGNNTILKPLSVMSTLIVESMCSTEISLRRPGKSMRLNQGWIQSPSTFWIWQFNAGC